MDTDTEGYMFDLVFLTTCDQKRDELEIGSTYFHPVPVDPYMPPRRARGPGRYIGMSKGPELPAQCCGRAILTLLTVVNQGTFF